jgi:hypothetical protein
MLKLMLGLATSGFARDKSGRRVWAPKPPLDLVKAILNPRSWPAGLGQLAFCPRGATEIKSPAPCRVELAASNTAVITGLRLTMWDAVLLIGETPTGKITRVVVRPAALVTRSGSRIDLSWLDLDPNGPIREIWW